MNTPTEIDNWDDFVRAFESVFHHDWANTLAHLSSIGNGTFLCPQRSEETPSWKNRDDLLEAYSRVKTNVELAVIQVQNFREETSKYEIWITGEVLVEDERLLSRADNPIEGNSAGNVMLLGAKRGLEKVLLPIYCKAAEKRTVLRLYGLLVPTTSLNPNSPEANDRTPSVTFITWKVHLPTDPDELPESERMAFTPDDRVSGYNVKLKPDSEALSLMETVLHEFELLQHHPRSCVIVMHGFIELLINALIEEKCKTGKKIAGNNRDYPHSIKLTILHELGLLDDVSFKRLSWFRKIRNDAAHEAVFTITLEKIQLFSGTKFAELSHFPLLCMDIFMEPWNAFPALFSSKFSSAGQVGTVQAEPAKGRIFTSTEGKG